LISARGFAAGVSLRGKWTIQDATVTYKISHLLKTAEGTSHAVKGKGECDANENCSFLVAVPVKTFESGNTNRDLHMIETVKGATYPMVVVQFSLQLQTDLAQPRSADAVVQFAGQTKTVHVDNIRLTRRSPKQIEADLTVPILLTEFQVERPSLLTVAIEDKVPVHAHGVWVHE
jgi:hypothetical protein